MYFFLILLLSKSKNLEDYIKQQKLWKRGKDASQEPWDEMTNSSPQSTQHLVYFFTSYIPDIELKTQHRKTKKAPTLQKRKKTVLLARGERKEQTSKTSDTACSKFSLYVTDFFSVSVCCSSPYPLNHFLASATTLTHATILCLDTSKLVVLTSYSWLRKTIQKLSVYFCHQMYIFQCQKNPPVLCKH